MAIVSSFGSKDLLALLMIAISAVALAQTTPTQTPSQTPKTAPQTAQILPSYEGQKVSSVEIAGRPEVNPEDYLPLLSIKKGEPFSRAKVEQSIAALQKAKNLHNVQLEVWPDPDGVRVLFVLQPALYFGIFEFPGAGNYLSYSRLLQVTNYPPRGEYNQLDVERAQEALQTTLKQSGFFLAKVRSEVLSDEQHGLANVRFHIELNKRAKFGEVAITGAPPDQAQELQKKLRSFKARLRGAAIRPNKTFRFKSLQNATEYLRNTLNKWDYLAAQVQLAGAKYDPESNRADVSYEVKPGPIVHVRVEGAHIWSWTKRKLIPLYQQVGVNPELIQEGRQNLVSYFQSKGYFDAKVSTQIQDQPSGETILYQITRGPRHRVADVAITGNQHIDEDELMSHIKLKKARFFSHGTYSEKALRTSIKNLQAVYNAAGYSSAKVTPQVTTKGENIIVTLRVDEGPQDIVENLNVVGNNTVPISQLAPQGLNLTPGKPYSQKLADEDRNRIVARYLELGYLTATFRQIAKQIQPHRLDISYNIYEGPQVRTATIVTLGRQNTQARLIRMDTKVINKGRPLTETDLLTSESELYNRGIFDWAQVDPRRQITTQTQEDVVIKVHESKRNILTYGVGFEVINRGGNIPSGTVAVPGLPPIGLPNNFTINQKTFYGPRGTIEYTRNNLRGKAESLTFSGLAGRLDQRAAITYIDPNFFWSSWTANYTIVGEHNSQNPIFTARQGQVAFQLQKWLDSKKTKNVTLTYTFSQTGLSQLLIPELVPPEDQHVRLSTLSATYTRDTRDNSLDAHKGMYQSFEFDINPSALGSSVDFAKVVGQASYYKTIPAKIVWANNLRIGLEQPFAGSHVPVSEKFFSGGASTLRGIPLNGAGPQRTIPACGDPNNPATCSLIQVPVGGNELFIVNSELRIPVPIKKGFGVVAFYDGGNVYPLIGFHDFTSLYTNNIGAGIRYSTPVGPLRIDIGHNLNSLPGIKATQIFITLGQAF